MLRLYKQTNYPSCPGPSSSPQRAAHAALAGARVGVRSLAAHRQVPRCRIPRLGLNFDQPADVHLNLLAEIALHAAFFFDFLARWLISSSVRSRIFFV